MGLGSPTVFQWPFVWLSICLVGVNLWQFCPGFLVEEQSPRIIYSAGFAPTPRPPPPHFFWND